MIFLLFCEYHNRISQTIKLTKSIVKEKKSGVLLGVLWAGPPTVTPAAQ